MVEIYTELMNEIERYRKMRLDRISDRTLENQVFVITNFARWLTRKNIKNFNEVDSELIETYINDINERSNKKRTGSSKEQYRIILRLFYRKMYDKGEIVEKIERYKSSSKHKIQTIDDIITPKDIEEAFKNPMTYPIRTKALILGLYESNARAGEFLDLKIKDVKFQNGITTFRIKSEKRRDNISIREVDCELCTPLIKDWLKIGHPETHNPEAPLWVALGNKGKGKPLGYAGLYKLCLDVLGKTPHHLRHSRSTFLALNGASEIQLMSHGGWNRPDMVYHYTKMAKRRAGKSIGIQNGNVHEDITAEMQGEFKDVSDWQKQQVEYDEMKQKIDRLEEAIRQLVEIPTVKEFMENK